MQCYLIIVHNCLLKLTFYHSSINFNLQVTLLICQFNIFLLFHTHEFLLMQLFFLPQGLSKDRSKREGHMHNTLWIFGTPCHQWRCVYRGPTNNHNHGNHGHRDNDPDRPSRTAKFHGNDSAFGSSKLSMSVVSDIL